MTRRLLAPFLWLAVFAGIGGTTFKAGQAPASTPSAITHLVIVVDGLRPDYVTPELMPRLAALGRRGVIFNAHHSVFPTVTRVNAPSFVTGVYPETHGLLGNTIYIPSADPARGLDTGMRQNLEAVARSEGRLLTAPTLAELLQQAGKKFLAVSSGSTGSSFLLNPTVPPGSAIVHHDYTLPSDRAARVLERLGPVPPHAIPNDGQNQRAIDAYLKFGLDDLHPDVTFMWINDPDETAHAEGIGSDVTRRALSLVDGGIGRIEDTLERRGLLDRTNILVTSDHGFSTHGGTLNLEAIVEPFARKMPDGSKDIVVAEGAVHFRARDPRRVAAVVAQLQRRPEVGAIFTRPGTRDAEGLVPGTLSFNVARWNHPRSADILVSANWSEETNGAGFKGRTTQAGVAGHGSSSPYDIHNTLIAIGPDFRERTTSGVPTGNVDIAPTLLSLLGLPVPQTMTGRVLAEALKASPAQSSVKVETVTDTVKTQDGRYELTAQSSVVDGHRYLDFTEVTRK
jgi:predicted AlkP superfamily pyrophosphatase or phosphodiesterase